MCNIYIKGTACLLLLFVVPQCPPLETLLELALLPKGHLGSLSLVQRGHSLKVNLQCDLKRTDGYILCVFIDFKQWLKRNEFGHLLCLKLNLVICYVSS
jgi:hypothetical protein